MPNPLRVPRRTLDVRLVLRLKFVPALISLRRRSTRLLSSSSDTSFELFPVSPPVRPFAFFSAAFLSFSFLAFSRFSSRTFWRWFSYTQETQAYCIMHCILHLSHTLIFVLHSDAMETETKYKLHIINDIQYTCVFSALMYVSMPQ